MSFFAENHAEFIGFTYLACTFFALRLKMGIYNTLIIKWHLI